MAMQVRGDRLPYDTAIQTKELFRTSQLLTALTHEAVQANKAIVGRNAFAHEAGITRTASSRTADVRDHATRGCRSAIDVGPRQALGAARGETPV